MQTAPAGWPTDDAELTPTASVTHTVNGSQETTTPVGWSVRRELATDLPDQIQAAQGLSVAAATIELAQASAETTTNAFLPWQGRAVVRQAAGASVELDVGFAGSHLPLFVGRCAEPSGDVTQPMLSLECDDLASLLRRPVTLPAVAREMPYTDGDTTSTLYTGLSPTWAIDAILRQAGFGVTPALVDGAALSLPLQNSVWPEVGTLISAGQGDDTQPQFAAITWGDRRLAGWQAPSAATFSLTVLAGTDLLPLGDLHLSGWADGTTGTAVVDLRAGDDNDSRVTVTITASGINVRFRADTGAVDVDADYTFAGGPFDVDVERLTATTVRVTVTDSGGTQTDDITSGVFGGTLTNAVISLASGDLTLAGLQVTPQQAGTVAVDHEPSADLDLSLNSIDGTPGLADVTQWTALREIAAAELGALWMSEAGIPTFRNRDSLRGVGGTPLEVTARDSIVALQWWSSVEQTRSEIRVPVMPVAITATVDWSATVWELTDKIKVFERGRKPITIFAELDAVAIGLDTTWTQSLAGTQGSVFAAYTNPDGTGTLRGLVITTEIIAPRLVKLRIRSHYDHSTPSWIVDNNGDPRLVLRALATIAQPATAETFAVAENPEVVDTYGESVLELPQNRWMQDIGSAQAVADWLAEQTRQPQPIIRTLNVVPGPDTMRLQLGDVIELVDPVVMDATVRCVVTGITASGADGSVDLALRVRPLPYLFADFTDEWTGETFGDLDTELAGQTFADYNANPWRFDA